MIVKSHNREGLYSMRYVLLDEPLLLFADDDSLKLILFEKKSDPGCIPRTSREGMNDILEMARLFLDGYSCGKPAPLPPLDLSGCGEARRRIYRELMTVPFGRTVSYGELARRSGFPRGGRFAGNAMALNELPVVIPCHRVIRSNGSPGHYSAGDEVKLKLLRHEGIPAGSRDRIISPAE